MEKKKSKITKTILPFEIWNKYFYFQNLIYKINEVHTKI